MTPLSIAATGACTPVGTRAWQTASSLAAGLSAFTRQAIAGQANHRATVSRVPGIDPSSTGTERLVRLAAPALHEALRSGPPPATGWPLQRPIPLFVALPEPWAERPGGIDADRFALELPRALDLAPEFLPLTLYAGGAVGGADALSGAYRFMQAHPDVPEVLVGGVDSLADPAVVELLYQRRWVQVAGHCEGFVASEAAAFVRLSRSPVAGEFATVYPPAFGEEAAPRVGEASLLDGRALIQAARAALQTARMPADALHSYWSDMDGSPWRGAERASLSAAFAADGGLAPARDPAAFLGEVGAAWVPLMLSLFHEMRQALSHPVMPARLAGHAGLQAVTGLSTRTAAWVATWDHARPARPAAGAGRGALPIPS
ncbi:3-oxoacyl-(acyl-carrier-protein) synthase [Paracidovorax avenae ATCC 19860]|uniref:3-oxoacyl-(Acyl-carrier-protein) synthase n=1 Tax=Paracidovorax avenae (strain ATCC 19860 / DSM 7227 / CCUG 15838 / JCM 20985 / LMG 2117 / NCPPB 1011) TaxID=643561 RepID=F0QA07_PARA1|nr:3-oxoacyl-ACP synthase [Paracidovorax avenae]ADX47267.1 3-oxoacyl-(acyl-carrier-protein) synthase [Paracidovorax avenae ATCC 19860]